MSSVEVRIPAGVETLPGDLTLPASAKGLVLFAHGSGSSRMSARNRGVADALAARGLGTLLFDLLTGNEGRIRSFVFDIELLAERLVRATHWARREPATRGLPLAYFGASTGAAAALIAAAGDPEIAVVVSRGGRVDLAQRVLSQVDAPTLLIVGELDHDVLELNRTALAVIPAEKQLAIVPGASHLFEEPGCLEQVAQLAGAWIERHLVRVEHGDRADVR